MTDLSDLPFCCAVVLSLLATARQPLYLVLVLDMNRSIASQGKLELICVTIR